jgi:DNA-directed RNA polymerase
MMDSQTLTVSRYVKQTERTAHNMGWGDTDGALGISSRYIDETTSLVASGKKYLKPREHGPMIGKLPSELLALVALTSGISGVINGETLAHMPLWAGKVLEDECFAFGLSTWDADRATELTALVKKSTRRLDYRRSALRALAQKANFPWTAWTSRDHALAGRWLVEIMLETSVFTLDDERNFTLTQDALDVSDTLVQSLMERYPVLLPLTAPPAPWQATTTLVHGYTVPLVRSRDPLVQRTLKAAIKDGSMADPLSALNAAQAVAYRINQPIVDVVDWAHRNHVVVPGMPPKADIPMPPRLTDAENLRHRHYSGLYDAARASQTTVVLPAEQLVEAAAIRLKLKARRDVKLLNMSYIGERLALHQDIATANQLSGAPYWTPMNFDYRGRVYGCTRFTFGRQDYCRAMFSFEQGCVLTTDGLYWLKVHLANCGGFDKIDKQPFAARVNWVDNHMDDILEYASDPQQSLGWTEADSPFLFLAACTAMRTWFLDRNSLCHIPVGFDGSCSGLQHLGAMTRDTATCELVNLTAGDKPNDVYQVVADLAAQTMQRDLAVPETAPLAKLCLDFGMGRSLVKRNVMTFSYSSKAFGMSEQHMEDTMTPLQNEVLEGKRPVHPFGDFKQQLLTSRYLAKVVYRSIEQTVTRPAQAMAFLQGIAKTMSHEGKPVVWHTPLGFPVVMRYPNFDTKRVTLALHDRGVQLNVSPVIAFDIPGIDKRKAAAAISASFVHSLDACHLLSVVNAVASVGITSVALVHDSFSCLPNVANEFRSLIKSEFHDMYEQNDVLFDILREAAGQLDNSWIVSRHYRTRGTTRCLR